MDLPEYDYYIPYRMVFQICRFHDENHLRPDGGYVCQHPDATTGQAIIPCTSNCVARKKLGQMVTPVPKGSLDSNPSQPGMLPPLSL